METVWMNTYKSIQNNELLIDEDYPIEGETPAKAITILMDKFYALINKEQKKDNIEYNNEMELTTHEEGILRTKDGIEYLYQNILLEVSNFEKGKPVYVGRIIADNNVSYFRCAFQNYKEALEYFHDQLFKSYLEFSATKDKDYVELYPENECNHVLITKDKIYIFELLYLTV